MFYSRFTGCRPEQHNDGDLRGPVCDGGVLEARYFQMEADVNHPSHCPGSCACCDRGHGERHPCHGSPERVAECFAELAASVRGYSAVNVLRQVPRVTAPLFLVCSLRVGRFFVGDVVVIEGKENQPRAARPKTHALFLSFLTGDDEQL